MKYPTVPFFDAVTDCTGGNAKVQKKDYQSVGELPVIDQGQEFVAGYAECVKQYSGALPVILFGDHTRIFKYVDFPFALGADGVKVLQPSSEFNAGYLYYFFRSVDLPNAGYSRHFKYLKDIAVLKPPISEQLRIVELLSRAEGIVRLRHEAEKKAAELIPALFLDMFGDPATNPKGWPTTTVGNAIESADYGSSTKASADSSGLPLIRMGNVSYAGSLDLSDLKYVKLPLEEVARYKLRKDDILFNRTNSKELVGKTGLWDGRLEAIAASYFIRIRTLPSVLRPFYFWAYMNSAHMKHVLYETARGAIGQANINSKELKEFKIVLPPLHLQSSFEDRCRDIFAIQSQQSAATAKAQAAFDALLARAFSFDEVLQ